MSVYSMRKTEANTKGRFTAETPAVAGAMARQAKNAERMFSFLLRRQKGERTLFKSIRGLVLIWISSVMGEGNHRKT